MVKATAKRKTTAKAKLIRSKARGQTDPEQYLRRQLASQASLGDRKAKPEQAARAREIAIDLAKYLMPFDRARKLPEVEQGAVQLVAIRLD